MSRAEPFGYYKNEEGIKVEIPDQLEALKQAEYYIMQGCAMAPVRNWLVKKTGRVITVAGLLKAIRYNGRPEKRSNNK